MSPQQMTLINQVEKRLLELRDIASNTVAAGRGQGKAADLLATTPVNSSLYSPRYGNAVQAEFFRLLLDDHNVGQLKGKKILTSQGVSDGKLDFANSYAPKRPDVRLAIGNGREAVWDLTTIGELRKSNKGHGGDRYGSYSFADYIADLPYRR